MKRNLISSVVVAMLTVAGCAEPTGAPSDELSAADVQDLAPQSTEMSAFLLDDLALASARILNGPRGGDSQYTRTRACPEGGEIRVEGSSKVTGDRATGTFSVLHTATKTFAACAFATRDGTLVKQDGQVTLAGTRNVVNRQLSGLQTSTQKGSVSWTRGTKSGTCVSDLTTTFDPVTRTVTVKGTMCGRTVDRTHTRNEPRSRP